MKENVGKYHSGLTNKLILLILCPLQTVEFHPTMLILCSLILYCKIANHADKKTSFHWDLSSKPCLIIPGCVRGETTITALQLSLASASSLPSNTCHCISYLVNICAADRTIQIEYHSLGYDLRQEMSKTAISSVSHCSNGETGAISRQKLISKSEGLQKCNLLN